MTTVRREGLIISSCTSVSRLNRMEYHMMARWRLMIMIHLQILEETTGGYTNSLCSRAMERPDILNSSFYSTMS